LLELLFSDLGIDFKVLEKVAKFRVVFRGKNFR
jgi:hypothetical protein